MEYSRDHQHALSPEKRHAAGHVASGHMGHDKHAGHGVEMFRNRLWVCLAFTVPALIWEPVLQDWFGYQARDVPGAAYIPAIFGTAVFVYGGWVFLLGAWRELAGDLRAVFTSAARTLITASSEANENNG